MHSCWCILLVECGLNSNFYLNSNLFELEIGKIRNRKRKAKPKTQPLPGPPPSPLRPSSFPRGPAPFFPQPARARHLPSPLPGLPRARSGPNAHAGVHLTPHSPGPACQRSARSLSAASPATDRPGPCVSAFSLLSQPHPRSPPRCSPASPLGTPPPRSPAPS